MGGSICSNCVACLMQRLAPFYFTCVQVQEVAQGLAILTMAIAILTMTILTMAGAGGGAGPRGLQRQRAARGDARDRQGRRQAAP